MNESVPSRDGEQGRNRRSEVLYWLGLAAVVGVLAAAAIIPDARKVGRLKSELADLKCKKAALRRVFDENAGKLETYRTDPRLALEHDLRDRGYVAPGEAKIYPRPMPQDETTEPRGDDDAGEPGSR